jgi:hypothetical protein
MPLVSLPISSCARGLRHDPAEARDDARQHRAVIPKFKQIGATKIRDPRSRFAIDHDIQNITPENLGKYAKIDAFAREQGSISIRRHGDFASGDGRAGVRHAGSLVVGQ